MMRIFYGDPQQMGFGLSSFFDSMCLLSCFPATCPVPRETPQCLDALSVPSTSVQVRPTHRMVSRTKPTRTHWSWVVFLDTTNHLVLGAINRHPLGCPGITHDLYGRCWPHGLVVAALPRWCGDIARRCGGPLV